MVPWTSKRRIACRGTTSVSHMPSVISNKLVFSDTYSSVTKNCTPAHFVNVDATYTSDFINPTLLKEQTSTNLVLSPTSSQGCAARTVQDCRTIHGSL